MTLVLVPQRPPRQLRLAPVMLVHVPSEFVLESEEEVLFRLGILRRERWLPSLQVWLFKHIRSILFRVTYRDIQEAMLMARSTLCQFPTTAAIASKR